MSLLVTGIKMNKKNVEIDPEFIDVLIQSISVLSNVATLASAWLMLRNHVDRQVNGKRVGDPT
jgi:hypothetical protein